MNFDEVFKKYKQTIITGSFSIKQMVVSHIIIKSEGSKQNPYRIFDELHGDDPTIGGVQYKARLCHRCQVLLWSQTTMDDVQ